MWPAFHFPLSNLPCCPGVPLKSRQATQVPGPVLSMLLTRTFSSKLKKQIRPEARWRRRGRANRWEPWPRDWKWRFPGRGCGLHVSDSPGVGPFQGRVCRLVCSIWARKSGGYCVFLAVCCLPHCRYPKGVHLWTSLLGHYVHAGNILATQRHFRWHPGAHVSGFVFPSHPHFSFTAPCS